MPSDKQRRVMALVVLTSITLTLGMAIGRDLTKRSDAEISEAAFLRLRGDGNVPGINEESATGAGGIGFQPSDSPPHCLPNGTVTYEAYDGAANMRYWVFRWPEGKGYAIVPRLMLDDEGRLVPYTPPRFVPSDEDAEQAPEDADTFEGTLEVTQDGD